jgi:hypothetical protein
MEELLVVMEHKAVHHCLDQPHQQLVVDMVEPIQQILVDLVVLVVVVVDLLVDQALQHQDKETLVELVLQETGLVLVAVVALVDQVEMVEHLHLQVTLLMILAVTVVLAFNYHQCSTILFRE